MDMTFLQWVFPVTLITLYFESNFGCTLNFLNHGSDQLLPFQLLDAGRLFLCPAPIRVEAKININELKINLITNGEKHDTRPQAKMFYQLNRTNNCVAWLWCCTSCFHCLAEPSPTLMEYNMLRGTNSIITLFLSWKAG